MRRSIIPFVIAVILCFGCTKDIGYLPFCDKNPSTYNAVIKPIIDQKCSGPYCHHDGSYFGDLTSFVGLKEKIDKGTFKTMVYDNKIMPPSSFDQLTEDEYKKIKCWLDDGAPQN
jgi:uncharacterized membrane protein